MTEPDPQRSTTSSKETFMDWSDQPATQPAHSPPSSPPAAPALPAPQTAESDVRTPVLSAAKRGIATVLLAVGLLVVGGVAAVSAADPSGSPAPAATSQPSDGSGGTAPDASSQPGGQAAPNGGARTHGDCPGKGTGASGTDGSGGTGSSPAPATNGSTSSPSTDNL
jgi:hypothetical protein